MYTTFYNLFISVRDSLLECYSLFVCWIRTLNHFVKTLRCPTTTVAAFLCVPVCHPHPSVLQWALESMHDLLLLLLGDRADQLCGPFLHRYWFDSLSFHQHPTTFWQTLPKINIQRGNLSIDVCIKWEYILYDQMHN